MCHIIIIAVLLLAGVVTHVVSKKPNTPLEQMIETAIKMESGLNVDFSEDCKVRGSCKPVDKSVK